MIDDKKLLEVVCNFFRFVAFSSLARLKAANSCFLSSKFPFSAVKNNNYKNKNRAKKKRSYERDLIGFFLLIQYLSIHFHSMDVSLRKTP